jgi:septal ring factor EnvC (AmiA/AmiB activator)
MKQGLALATALLLALAICPRLRAQADDDTMSQQEIESLRDAAYIPRDRIAAFERILNSREQEIRQLLAQSHRPGFAQDMHDYIDQFGAIADEFNDNLDDYSSKHRDVRKALPKLLSDIERWSTTLRAPADDDSYNIVRRIALDSLKDMRDSATRMQTEQAAYFKAHPDAAKLEKERADPNHAPVPNEDSH